MKFDIVYSDPPWKQNKRTKSKRFGLGVPYATMETAAICEIPVKDICAKNCALFLWVTGPKLPDGLKVMEAWGFKYRTIAFTWVKTYKNKISPTFERGHYWIVGRKHKAYKNRIRPVFGIGYYTKSNAELCLLGVRGKMKPVSDFVSQVILMPPQEHSRKPACARERIVKLFGDRPRIELFARQTTYGWFPAGNEITGEDITVALTRLASPRT